MRLTPTPQGGLPRVAGGGRQPPAAPPLPILGGEDRQAPGRNEWARSWMRDPRDLAILPGTMHLSGETGALERVADLATGWFRRWPMTEAGHAKL